MTSKYSVSSNPDLRYEFHRVRILAFEDGPLEQGHRRVVRGILELEVVISGVLQLVELGATQETRPDGGIDGPACRTVESAFERSERAQRDAQNHAIGRRRQHFDGPIDALGRQLELPVNLRDLCLRIVAAPPISSRYRARIFSSGGKGAGFAAGFLSDAGGVGGAGVWGAAGGACAATPLAMPALMVSATSTRASPETVNRLLIHSPFCRAGRAAHSTAASSTSSRPAASAARDGDTI